MTTATICPECEYPLTLEYGRMVCPNDFDTCQQIGAVIRRYRALLLPTQMQTSNQLFAALRALHVGVLRLSGEYLPERGIDLGMALADEIARAHAALTQASAVPGLPAYPDAT